MAGTHSKVKWPVTVYNYSGWKFYGDLLLEFCLVCEFSLKSVVFFAFRIAAQLSHCSVKQWPIRQSFVPGKLYVKHTPFTHQIWLNEEFCQDSGWERRPFQLFNGKFSKKSVMLRWKMQFLLHQRLERLWMNTTFEIRFIDAELAAWQSSGNLLGF